VPTLKNYSGENFQGSYIAGIYYPDKTKVGWWKNGYPNISQKLNALTGLELTLKLNLLIEPM
jgi:maltose phosphorylase